MKALLGDLFLASFWFATAALIFAISPQSKAEDATVQSILDTGTRREVIFSDVKCRTTKQVGSTPSTHCNALVKVGRPDGKTHTTRMGISRELVQCTQTTGTVPSRAGPRP